MARTPRAHVSKTFRQGVSRLSYQKGRALSGDAPKVGRFEKGESGQKRGYGKAKSEGKYPAGFDVSYGDTFLPTDLEEVKALGEGAPPKGWDMKRTAAKKMKGG